MKYPDLPEDCPLSSATDCDGEVFMLFADFPCTDGDCLTQAERGRALAAQGDGICTRHGLSVFPSLEACAHQRTLIPWLGKKIGRAVLTADHGMVADTPTKNPGHMTWWPYPEVQRHALFQHVDET